MIQIADASLAALANRFGTRMDDLTYVGGGKEESDGVLYAYRDPGASADMVLKILAIPKADEARAFKEIDERTRFVYFLGEQGMEITHPVLNRNGNLLETLEADGHILTAYTMHRIAGNTPKREERTKDFYIKYGQTVGKLHRLTQSYPKWKGNAPDGDGEVLNWRDEWSFFYNWCKDEEVKQGWQEVRKELERLPVTRESFGFIHNDPHIENIMLDGSGNVILIDFDVANYHWFANDIAIASQFLLFSPAGGMSGPFQDFGAFKSFYQHFMDGYERENHLDALFLARLELFINYRRLLMYTISQGWLESHPEQQTSWKKMIAESGPLGIFG
ncbi:phosphotransferase enzyme family protein [Paenibacillus tengchongensis]|uniref:phosphotransferase enzyme family protein n=1 Tax=Paenibacillus tengchongensis TaxID=2608684 RepID=UPI0016520DD7|nr:phosphotransferase [Paenibacillus tengchongensis]